MNIHRNTRLLVAYGSESYLDMVDSMLTAYRKNCEEQLRVYVMGEVKTPGALEVQMHEEITASLAILRAGSFTDFAQRKKVKIVHRGPGPDHGKTEEVNMEDVMTRGQANKDVVLQPGDLVVVPSKAFNM